jgi:6-phospho-beta-glucosidase
VTAAIRWAYIGGGSTRAPGTVASFIEHHGDAFDGSEIVLMDLNADHLSVVEAIARGLVRAKGLKIAVSSTTDRRKAMTDCDAVLTSFRPGDFAARYVDESVPLRYGIVGQETQGPGGFFMALRSVHIMSDIVADMEQVCPDAFLFNYTNPVNIVLEAVTRYSSVRCVSLCEGPIIFPKRVAQAAGLDDSDLEATMVGLNHNVWGVGPKYKGEDAMPFLREGYDRLSRTEGADVHDMRLLQLTLAMEAIPSYYWQYYYFHPEEVEELRAKSTTRSQDIMAAVPVYWEHYREQAEQDHPQLDPSRSRGGIYELELAFDVMDAMFNDRREVLPVNVRNQGALADFPEDLVVEVPGYVDKDGIRPLAQGHLPRRFLPMLEHLAQYQVLAAEAAWQGDRDDGVRALLAHPFVLSLDTAEKLYDEMANALKDYLPARLLG